MMLTPTSLTLEAARTLEAVAETDALIADMSNETALIVGHGEYDESLRDFLDKGGTCIRVIGSHENSRAISVFRHCYGNVVAWSPSTDANAAIEAAEAVRRLLVSGDGKAWSIWSGVNAWSVGEVFKDGCELFVTDAPTFALAICRAIAVRHVLERDK